MRARRGVAVTAASALMVLSSAMGAYATTPGPVQTAPQDLSQTQLAQVRKVLTDGGLPAAAVEAVMADRTQVAQIPVASSGEETHGAEAVPSGSGFAAPATMGSVCTGYGAWVQRKQYVRNVYNGILAWAALRTDFCYNNSRVTYTNSTRTHGVTALGSPTLNWNGWDDLSEGWYLYNGRTYGGVKSTTQGNFNECIVKYGCFTTDTLTMRTYAHYDGTSSASGSSY